MKKKTRVMSAVLALMCFLPTFVSCNSTGNDEGIETTAHSVQETTENTSVADTTVLSEPSIYDGEPGPVSEKGALQWTILVTQQLSSFGGVDAAD